MLFPQPSGPPPDDAGHAVCSARGCRAHGVWALRWNNPKLHTPDRRKTWLACDEHRTSLSEFLSLRGFLREVDEVGAPPSEPTDDGP
ncbi:hypothetical protein [Kineosporia sp. R_H_3]|uniref:hypothetical protein n=1 Tax=Kineosporia sp. R_H_3 TaxID=1961848 RepID=UPI000B4BAE6E|nr:hypothetical protein [Kineosporia sp. R_H_3]